MKTLAAPILLLLCLACTGHPEDSPRVFIFTDINIDQGDPDDRQSLIHLLWYSDELRIEGIVPDRWNADGYAACTLALEAYGKDFNAYGLGGRGYPDPLLLKEKVAGNRGEAEALFLKAASDTTTPLYVLVWGNMLLFKDLLFPHPQLAENLRLITIGTGLMMEAHIPHLPPHWKRADRPCEQYNWNGFGRAEVFGDPRFREMWWLEINWTYEGMFPGDEPRQMFDSLQAFGSLGRHMEEVVANQPWARYFRVGDTPSVLYVIDPGNDRDDPTSGSWAGRYVRPFPGERPHYFTDDPGAAEWNYGDPCLTWENHREVNRHATSTLLEQRDHMYASLLGKLRGVYR